MKLVFSIIVLVFITFFLSKDVLKKDQRFWAFIIFFQHIPLIIFDQLGSEIVGMGYFVIMVFLYLLKCPKFILSKARLSNPITYSLILFLSSLFIHYFIIGINPNNIRGLETFRQVMIFNWPIIGLCLFSIKGDDEFLLRLMDGLVLYGFFFLITVLFASGLAEMGVGERGGFRDDFRISPLAAAKTAGVIIIAAFIKYLNENSFKEKLFSLFVLAICVLLIFVTASRAALLFLLIVLAIYVIFSNYSAVKKSLIIISFVTVSTSLYLIIVQLDLSVVQRLQALENYEDTLRYTRLEIIFDLVENFEMGLLGLGPFGFGYFTGLNYPHNLIAEYTIDYGFIGLIAFLLLLIPSLYYSFHLIKSKYQIPSFIALIFIYLFLSSLTSGDIVSARDLQFVSILIMNYMIFKSKIKYTLN
ncbi:O-antigen ligase family protein [Litoribacter alkaliphilus]|uniref:O-antigen ligase family protein n=1 Tax=Litoribacter ruber TaxID=702568 RepID=A0AAP2CNP4_9BACT|nr:O-antigen ligase family protein [Litoribacter alkaliphilus]MBS9525885.1 O-antigen ligase family protein [Litoribacter alkaliphilus]